MSETTHDAGLEERDFVDRLGRAGFADASVEVTNVHDGSDANNMCGAPPMPDNDDLERDSVSRHVRSPRSHVTGPR